MTTDAPPPSLRSADQGPRSFQAPPPAPAKPLFKLFSDFVIEFGQIGRMTFGAFTSMVKRPLELGSTVYRRKRSG